MSWLWRIWRLVPHRRRILRAQTTRCWRCGYRYSWKHKEG